MYAVALLCSTFQSEYLQLAAASSSSSAKTTPLTQMCGERRRSFHINVNVSSFFFCCYVFSPHCLLREVWISTNWLKVLWSLWLIFTALFLFTLWLWVGSSLLFLFVLTSVNHFCGSVWLQLLTHTIPLWTINPLCCTQFQKVYAETKRFYIK